MIYKANRELFERTLNDCYELARQEIEEHPTMEMAPKVMVALQDDGMTLDQHAVSISVLVERRDGRVFLQDQPRPDGVTSPLLREFFLGYAEAFLTAKRQNPG
jgi:hypothetical protein